eukprot:scaffold19061_cov31-Tisochrysis_lutea.AAC.4
MSMDRPGGRRALLSILLSVGVAKCALPRISIGDRDGVQVFLLGQTPVYLMGANYVVKAAPYLPPLDVVRADAQMFAQNAARMSYSPPYGGLPVVPVVRLGCIFEAAMPERGQGIDASWAARLEETVEAFGDAGVYVFLDNHQDALSASNGGEGLPYWMAAELQSRNPHEPFTISPSRPLEMVGGFFHRFLLRLLGIQDIQTIGWDDDPWGPFAHDNTDGDDPNLVNLGNPSVRLNNNDDAWHEGRILFTKQCNNLARRFFLAPFGSEEDMALLFTPFIDYIVHLSGVWERHTNVVAIDLFNEPPFWGLPSLFTFVLFSRRALFAWYGAVLDALEERGVRAPVAYEDIMGSFTYVLSLAGVPFSADFRLRRWARRKQLVLSFHHYRGTRFESSLWWTIAAAKFQSWRFGGPPIFLSEFGPNAVEGSALLEPENVAAQLAKAADLGVTASAYWHAANRNFTGQGGWFKYDGFRLNPIQALQTAPNAAETREAWKMYEETVRNGSYWGGEITGAGDAFQGVLHFVS